MNKFISILVRKYQISESFGRLIEDNIKIDRGMHEGLCGEGSFNKCNFYQHDDLAKYFYVFIVY